MHDISQKEEDDDDGDEREGRQGATTVFPEARVPREEGCQRQCEISIIPLTGRRQRVDETARHWHQRYQ